MGALQFSILIVFRVPHRPVALQTDIVHQNIIAEIRCTLKSRIICFMLRGCTIDCIKYAAGNTFSAYHVVQGMQ